MSDIDKQIDNLISKCNKPKKTEHLKSRPWYSKILFWKKYPQVFKAVVKNKIKYYIKKDKLYFISSTNNFSWSTCDYYAFHDTPTYYDSVEAAEKDYAEYKRLHDFKQLNNNKKVKTL